jgi:hypothetical protein
MRKKRCPLSPSYRYIPTCSRLRYVCMHVCAVTQGDQIGRIFALWMVVNSGQFFNNYKTRPHFRATFSTVKVMH